MPHIAFYRVVSDQNDLIFPSEGDVQERTFETTNDIVLNESSARPMVCFQMDPSSKNETPRAKVEVFIRGAIGDQKICEYNLSGTTFRWTMEPFPPEWVKKGQNKLVFKVNIGAGELTIKNVVVFFTRDI